MGRAHASLLPATGILEFHSPHLLTGAHPSLLSSGALGIAAPQLPAEAVNVEQSSTSMHNHEFGSSAPHEPWINHLSVQEFLLTVLLWIKPS